MTVVKGGKSKIVLKLSPTGRVVLSWRPRPYPRTEMQRRFADIARKCGVHKGMTRKELVEVSMPCIKAAWNKTGLDYQIRLAVEAQDKVRSSLREAIRDREAYERKRDRR